MSDLIPASVVADAVGSPAAVVVSCAAEPIPGSSGAATAGVTRLVGRAAVNGRERPFTLIRKQFRPVTTGRHAEAATDPRHWAYWRREPLAYQAALTGGPVSALPTGPGLTSPPCYGVLDDVVYLQDVTGPAESPRLAAARLGEWQATATVPAVPWLAGHQLAQRIAVSDLDWTRVDARPWLAALWARRHDLLAELRGVPGVLSHGDFHAGNLIAAGGATVVLDWGTLGTGPAGADLAHLALSTMDDTLVDAYLTGAAGRLDPREVLLGYRTTLALTGASRIHWMLSAGIPVPPGYEDLVRPADPHPGR
ncbi:hypothetical protein Lfu02_13410 [Longispora fulva]|uniref:Aminoglycoside phosphotransferase domain-containing protein n=1 Tax=Longispora fulva TaxID=619741 RepID=A0A8J7GNX0_9ACTN|nr:aminoglycoside phosphotransferase family protein [Longispora fulva]MBG6140647.1 hypothetical protein [Longispora fulva]GIG56969.1 hypothetical protein Lfu02_13410 [Longispora fulva]